MKEKWKAIKGYDNYSVSTLGRVRNDKTGRILKSNSNNKGYLFVGLSKNCKGRSEKIHRLVADAFIENVYNLPIVDHIDRDRKNNEVSNLRWSTHSANTRNGARCINAVSKFNGVHKNGNSWRAQVVVNQSKIHLGYFEKDTEAAKAFNKFCIENGLKRELNIITEA